MVHTRTAIDEVFGRSISRSITANADAPLPYGPGGARLLIYSATAGLSVRLPQATLLQEGVGLYSVYNSGANTFTITDWGGNTVQTVLAGRIAELSLMDNTTSNGSWLSQTWTAAAGTALTIGRVPLSITIGANLSNVNLRTLANAEGYAGDVPLALKVEILQSININSVSSTQHSLQTGTFYPGTTVTLINRGIIQGAGGNGGQGGLFGSAGVAGTAGGKAVYAQNNLTLINLGTIAGGGGGGGGGGSLVVSLGGGGGGGGGQGSSPGSGGAGSAGGTAGQAGSGVLGLGGAGGSAGGGRGGDGGSWGSAGSAGTTPGGGGAGGAGGAAGHALYSVGGGVVITKLTSGIIYGPEVLT